MVTMGEINRDRIRALVNNHILPLHIAMKGMERIEIAISSTEAKRHIAKIFHKAGWTCKQIANALGITEDYAKRSITCKGTKGFKNAERLLQNPMVLLNKSDEYAFGYLITKKIVERLMIEDFVRAGWTAKQIRLSTGFNYRTIQRIRKQIGEENE